MTALMSESIALSFQGDVAGALRAISTSLASASEIGEYFEYACYPNFVMAHLAAGDAAAAWEASQPALPSVGHRYQSANGYWIVYAALAAGELETANSVAEVVMSMAHGCWAVVGLAVRARVEIARGEFQAAEDDLHRALVAASRSDAKVYLPDAFDWLAQLASVTDSHREAARLIGSADALRHRMGAVRLKIFEADHLTTVSTIRDAIGDNEFEAAWTEGAALSAEEAIAYAQRGRGERKRPSTGWASLTPTELEVVRLVAEGIPNKDIATRLFVSPRTVQSHLRHVYNKLNLTSRVQLAQEAARQMSAAK
jgi:DNA-binding CsgD family transcriptional regulator